MRRFIFLVLLFVLFALSYFVINYLLYFHLGKLAYKYDGDVFDITLKSFFYFNFIFNFIGIALKWLLLSILIYGAIRYLDIEISLALSIKTCIVSEFVFLLVPINTLFFFSGKYEFGREDLINSENFFNISNLVRNFDNTSIIGSFNLLNLLYLLVATLLISKYAKIKELKALLVSLFVFAPPFVIKKLLIILFTN
jgi:hypothetical protein